MARKKKNKEPIPFNGSHRFMAEELLSPSVGTTDLTRLNMFISHWSQRLELNDPEFPKVFTGFENQVGKFSPAYKRFPNKEGFVLVKEIIKNRYNRFYIFVNEKTKEVFTHLYSSSVKLTEDYGFLNVNRMESVKEGDEIKPERIISRATCFDRFMNTLYGVNLKVAFYPWRAQTYEDSIVVNKKAAQALFSTHVKKVKVAVNTNDIFMNIYGDNNHYKCFPNVGEKIVDKIILARRRLSFDSLLYDFSKENMNRINYDTDDVFYSNNGTVTDIEIYCNANIDDLEDREYAKQITEILRNNLRYYGEIVEVLKPYKDKGYKFLDESNYYLRRASDMISGKKFRDDSSDFDNLIVELKIEEPNPLTYGSKLTGR